MTEQSSKELTETLVQVRMDIRELMVEIRGLKDLSNKVGDHETRITTVESTVTDVAQRQKEAADNTKWLWRTVGAVFLIGAVNAVIQYMSGGVPQ